MSFIHSTTRIGIWLVICASIVGCDDSDSVDMSQTQVSTHTKQRSDLEQGLSFLSRLEKFEAMQVHQKIQYHLQQWMKKQKAEAEWSVDPLLAELPAFRRLASGERLAELEFKLADVEMLQEATWMRDVARAILEHNVVPPGLQQQIEQATEGLDASAAADLAVAVKLFDWTVRNLLLDADSEPGDTQRTDQRIVLQAWESLMMGRGTADEKSRVFILLARQVGLPVVMLAVKAEDQPLRNWLPASMIGDQLYLFDMRLGIPLPSRDGTKIATLQDVINNPGILEALAQQTGTSYPVSRVDSGGLVAFIDATPACLSRRMQMLERVLTGEQKMVLTVSPAQIAKRLQECGVTRVGIWALNYEGIEIRRGMTPQSRALAWLNYERQLFDRRSPLHEARLLHFRGQYEPINELPGARQFYLSCRTPDAQIQTIRNKPLELPEGYDQPTKEQLANYQRQLNALGDLMVRTKQNASFWLGLIAFDRGEYPVAVDYFDQRVLKAFPGSIWTSTARYNLGRAYEAMARQDDNLDHWKQAVDVYRLVDHSPWTAACRWRAAEIERQILKATSQQGSNPETQSVPPTGSENSEPPK